MQGICGKEANDYALGLCGIRWAFVMAFICIIDSFILCILAIVLSNRNVEPLPPSTIPPHLRGKLKKLKNKRLFVCLLFSHTPCLNLLLGSIQWTNIFGLKCYLPLWKIIKKDTFSNHMVSGAKIFLILFNPKSIGSLDWT